MQYIEGAFEIVMVYRWVSKCCYGMAMQYVYVCMQKAKKPPTPKDPHRHCQGWHSAEVVKFTRSEVVAAWWSEEKDENGEFPSGSKASLLFLHATVSNDQNAKASNVSKSGSVKAKDAEVAKTQACGSERFRNLLSWSSLHAWLSSILHQKHLMIIEVYG